MDTRYVWLKLLHIFVVVVTLGASAGLGIVLEFHGKNPAHGSFILRVIGRMVAAVVVPGYLLVLATGAWMASLAGLWATRWVQLALGLWVVGLFCLGGSLVTLRKQGRLQGGDGARSTRYALASRAFGAAFGFVVVAILYLMVFKP